MRITLADVDNYLAVLPEAARAKFLRENGEAIRFLYDREKQQDEGGASPSGNKLEGEKVDA